MKTIVYTKYGPPEVLKLKEVNKPTPKDNEVLIRIYATTVTSGDVKLRSFNLTGLNWFLMGLYSGFKKPKRPILGNELAGVIESVGKNVKEFKKGDQVFGSTGFDSGTYAEYKCLPEDGPVAIKPTNLTYEEATSIPFGAHTALHFLKKAKIKKGQKVLIYGASGSVGTAAVQLAKYFGAEVTGVSTNLELVESLGADKVIDYTKEDYKKSGPYDVIFETVGKSSFSDNIRLLKKNGIYLLGAVFKMSWYLGILWKTITSSKKLIGGVASERKEDLIFLKKLIEERKLKPVIDRTYPLEQIAEAHRYVDKGHKKGSVVITLEYNNKT